MGKGFNDISHTTIEALPEQQEAVKSEQQTADETAEGERLAQSVLHFIEAGEHPATVLYTACKCIGLLMHDSAFTEQAAGSLDAIYSQLMQQSLLEDRARQEAEQLQERRKEFYSKTKSALETQQRKLDRLDVELDTVRIDLIEAIAEIERTLAEEA